MNLPDLILPGIGIALGLFVWLVARFFWASNRAPEKGRLGEYQVNTGLSHYLDPDTYRLIEDVTLPFGNGTTQIDQIIVSPYGIFVIETKNMTGWIFGDPFQPRWTQVVYEEKYRFQNPLRQNYRHLKVVQDLLRLKPHQTFNVVIFVGDSVFKTPMPPEVVDNVEALVSYIYTKTDVIFDETTCSEFVDHIAERRLEQGRATDFMHIRNVEDQGNLCPLCGGELVQRTNRQTSEIFWGCRRFPKCKGTRPFS